MEREEIFTLLRQYYKQQTKTKNPKSVPCAGRVSDIDEVIAMTDAVLDEWWTEGKYAAKFEKELCLYLGLPQCHLVNSGSSANLLAVSALTSPLLPEDERLLPGNEVITVAAGFPTTINPILQNGAIPVFVDVELGTYNTTPERVEAAITPKTRAIILAHTLGNPYNAEKISQIAWNYNLFLIEDNCFVARTLVPTKNGTKHISELKEGDRVLGFDGISFKETIVKEIGSRLVSKDEVIVLDFENGTNVRCTKDHLFYFKGNWTKAQDLKIGDEVYHSTNSEFLTWRRVHKLTEKGRQKVSLMMKEKNPSYNPKNVVKSSTNRKHRITHIEQRVIDVIKQYQIPFEYTGNGTLWIGNDKIGYKNPDFVCKEKKILLEIYDPSFKYGDGYRGKKWEEKRSSFYQDSGYKTVFLSLKGFISKKEQYEIGIKLRQFVSNGIKLRSIKKIRDIKRLNLQIEPKDMVRVYNLKCEPFNNFCLTGGLLVHNCDALGSEYAGKKTGTFGDLCTQSFYPAHHITSGGEGGAVLCTDPLLSRIVMSLRDWGRDCQCKTGHDNFCGKRFDQQWGYLPQGYDHKFVYSHLGYNLKMTDIQAACGVIQMQKLPRFTKIRHQNFETYIRLFQEAYLDDIFFLPQSLPNAQPSWFGFPLTIKPNIKINRESLCRYLNDHGIATRYLFGGNITKQPYFLDSYFKYRNAELLRNTEIIMKNTFWVGLYPAITMDQIQYVVQTINDYVKER